MNASAYGEEEFPVDNLTPVSYRTGSEEGLDMKKLGVLCVGLVTCFTLMGLVTSCWKSRCTAPDHSKASENEQISVGNCKKEKKCSYRFTLYEHGRVLLNEDEHALTLDGCEGDPPNVAVISHERWDKPRRVKKDGTRRVSKGTLTVKRIDPDCGRGDRAGAHGVTFTFTCRQAN